jgi:hypothetical protein
MDVVLVPAGAGEVLAGPSGMRILEDGSNTGHRIGVMEDRLPPGLRHAPPDQERPIRAGPANTGKLTR